LSPGKHSSTTTSHQSVALDFAVSAPSEGVYTLMGPELDENGWVKDPVRLDWGKHSAFVTPPGWWHSHHNETDEMCWVLPIQDAGILTYQRALDITFSQPRTEFDLTTKPKIGYEGTKWIQEGLLPEKNQKLSSKRAADEKEQVQKDDSGTKRPKVAA